VLNWKRERKEKDGTKDQRGAVIRGAREKPGGKKGGERGVATPIVEK